MLQEKCPPNTPYDFGSQQSTDKQEEEIGQEKESFECYYCSDFDCFDNTREYEKHVISKHPNKIAYPGLMDLERYNLKPKGRKWEI